MLRNIMMQELNGLGYEVEAVNVNKNGVIREGIRVITDSNVHPVIYPYSYNNIDEVLDILKGTSQEMEIVYPTPENVLIGLAKEVDKSIIQRPAIGNTVAYIYVQLNDHASYKVPKGSGFNGIWKAAERNTFEKTRIFNMGSIIPVPDNDLKLYVVTNDSTFKGASAILDTESLRRFANEIHYSRFVAFPSSIHEFIIMPLTNTTDIDFCSQLVKDINSDLVSPEEQLGDEAFILEV